MSVESELRHRQTVPSSEVDEQEKSNNRLSQLSSASSSSSDYDMNKTARFSYGKTPEGKGIYNSIYTVKLNYKKRVKTVVDKVRNYLNKLTGYKNKK